MIGMTVCSGIGAPEVAAPWIDWRYQSEIEPFPSAVLAHRFPNAVNLGDMTKFQEWPDATVDVLVGGTPCQSFSVAGLRKGLDDPRGNLMLTFLAIARRYRPRWIVWENVPGVLSSNGGRDFGTFLGGLGECGYGWAYRVLDAQYVRTPRFPRAVPQRRRRVFVVGYLGDWRRAAAVLFEPEGLQGHPPPRREAGQVAPTIPARSLGGGGLETDFDCDGGLISSTGDVAHCLNAGGMGRIDYETETMVAHALRGEGFDASEDGTGRGTPLVPVAYGLSNQPTPKVGENVCPSLDAKTSGGGRMEAVAYRTTGNDGVYESGDVIAALTTGTDPNSHILAFSSKDYGADAAEGVSPTLRAGGHDGSHANAGVPPAIAIQERAISENPHAGPDGAGVRQVGAAYTLEARTVTQAVAFDLNQITSKTNRSQPDPAVHHTLPATSQPPHLATPWAVRRLTPTECEKLQGFPVGWTQIPYRNKPADQCPDGPRYKALGNSWAVNCGEFIFDRMRAVEGMP